MRKRFVRNRMISIILVIVMILGLSFEYLGEVMNVRAQEISKENKAYAVSTPGDAGVFVVDKEALENAEASMAEAGGILTLAAVDAYDGYTDYSEYMTEHNIIVDGKVIGDGATIDPTSDFMLELDFHMDRREMAKGGLEYYFPLPKHITVGDLGTEASPISLYNSRKRVIGTYYVKDDIIYVTFPGYYDEVYTHFSMQASWDETENLTSIVVPWKDGDQTFKIDLCELVVSKTSAGYVSDNEGNLVNRFTVKVTQKDKSAAIENITFNDILSVKNLSLYEDYYGEGKTIRLTRYNSKGVAVEQVCYDAAKVCTVSDEQIEIQIKPLRMEEGGYIKVEYATIIPKEERMKIDSSNGYDSYTNRATASYPYDNPVTGETETLSASTQIGGKYNIENMWIYKSSGETKTRSGKTIVPYTININKNRVYSLGGSIVQDAITNYTGGDVVYDISSSANCMVEATNKTGKTTTKQKWVVLSEKTYADLEALKASSKETALSKLMNNAELKNRLIAEINTYCKTDYTDFTNDMALMYVFTSAEMHNFVWFVPFDTTPTTYLLSYDTIVENSVAAFNNGANIWYTEFDSAPHYPGGDEGITWTPPKPVTPPKKNVMNTTKTNNGVYMGADGNYYVDYKIEVRLEAGSEGFDSLVLNDFLPSYKNIPVGSTKTTVYDWLPELDFSDGDTSQSKWKSAFKIYSDSTDPAVQQAVSALYLYPDSTHIYYSWESYAVGRFYPRTNVTYESIIGYGEKYTGETAPAGQYTCDKDYYDNRDSLIYKKGSTSSIKEIQFYFPGLPATDEGYSIEIEYTMQINPYLVKAIPELLENSKEKYIRNANSLIVRTNLIPGKSDNHIDTGDSEYKNRRISYYYLGIDDIEPMIGKSVSYQQEENILAYTLSINESHEVEAKKQEYEIVDALNITGLKYKENTLTICDADGRIVFTNATDKSVDTVYNGYADYITYTATKNDRDSNRFTLVLDNQNGHFTDADGKLMELYVTYDVDMTGFTTDLDIVNTAGLFGLETDPQTGVTIKHGYGDVTNECSIDKALSKELTQKPTQGNAYTAGYYVDINPNSANAKQLAEMKPGDCFTVRDTMSESMELDIDSVHVYRYKEGALEDKEDITENLELCNLNYDNHIFDTIITIENPEDCYRIEYNAKVTGAAGEYVTYSNSVKILGTDISEDKTDNKVAIYEYEEKSAAYKYKYIIKKYDKYNTNKKLQAKFDLYFYNKSTNKWILMTDGAQGTYKYDKIATGENGEALVENSASLESEHPVDLVTANTWYKLVECEASEGYLIDTTPIYFYVSRTGDTPTDVPYVARNNYTIVRVMLADAPDDEISVIYVGNEVFALDILKKDKGDNAALTGAEFALYQDAACKELIASSADLDEDGLISFRNIKLEDMQGQVYLKETRTPKDYIEKDTVCRLSLKDGHVAEVTELDASGNAVATKDITIQDADELSTITVYNYSSLGRLQVAKTVNSGRDSDKTQDFTFVLHFYNEDGTEVTDRTFPAVYYESDGTETKSEYTSGDIFYLKHDERLLLEELPANIKYKIQEVTDNHYTTLMDIVDNVGKDSKKNYNSRSYTGTVEEGSFDQITYTNTPVCRIQYTKIAETETGAPMEIPDGHTVTIMRGNSIMLEAVWNASKKCYECTQIGNVSYRFDNSIENGFVFEGLPSNASVQVYESNADIDGYAYSCTITGTQYSSANKGNYILESIYSSNPERNYVMRNTYYDNKTDAAFSVKKELVNSSPKDGQFKFNLYSSKNGSKPIQSVYNDADGNVNFEPISFSEADIGTKQYYVREEIPEGVKKVNGKYKKDGVYYSEESVYITVTVSKDEDGNIVVSEPIYSSDSSGKNVNDTITNIYEPEGSVKFTGTKVYRNADKAKTTWQSFYFDIKEYDEAYTTEIPMKSITGKDVTYSGSASYRYSSTSKSGEEFNISFPEINFYGVDAVGTHYFLVKERIPAGVDENNILNGVKYDATSYKVKVEVTDNGDGTLTAVPSYETDSDGLIFRNEYVAKGEFTPKGRKTMSNQSIEENEFTFAVAETVDNSSNSPIKKDEEGNDIIWYVSAPETEMDESTQKVVAELEFPTFHYDMDSLGTHYYRVWEIIPEDAINNKLDGLQYDARKYTFSISVSDDGGGRLRVSSNSSYATSLNFTNTYRDTTGISFTGNKTLIGRTLKNKDFQYVADITVYNRSNSIVDQKKNYPFGYCDEEGVIHFPEQKYDETDYGYRYVYVVRELIPDVDSADFRGGITYSQESYTVTVKIGRENGIIKPAVTYTDSNNNPVTSLDFTNLYSAEGSIAFSATKLLSGRNIKEGQFAFELCQDEAVLETVTNKADGSISFSPIEFYLKGTENGIEDNLGTYTYTIREVIPEEATPGYTYDNTEYEITVVAFDNGDGTIGFEVSGAAEDTSDDSGIIYKVTVPDTKDANFNNMYKAEGGFAIDVEKKVVDENGNTYDNLNMTASGKKVNFHFEAYEVKDSHLTFVTDAWAKPGVSGTMEIKFDESDVGTHRYMIVEKDEGSAGYSCDKTQYFVNAYVSDNGDGTLAVALKDDAGNAILEKLSFTNVYSASGKLILEGKKTVQDAEYISEYTGLTDKAFTFTVSELFETEELVVGSGSSDADGIIHFTDISYGLADVGMHYYKITENETSKMKNVLCSAAPVYVMVEVSDNGDGTLAVDTTYSRGTKKLTGAIFENRATYVEISKVDSDSNPLAGAKLTVAAEDGTVLYSFITKKDETYKLYGLDKETVYILHELEAPDGYLVAEDIYFKIGADGDIIVLEETSVDAEGTKVSILTMVDETDTVTDKPKTGDSSELPLAVLLLLSSSVLLGLLGKQRRNIKL